MGNKKSEQSKKCFIITPIGEENSDVFRRAKGVIESVIKPVLKEYGYDDIKPAYEINISGTINTQIINRIVENDLVIANLTGNNPNVMYELCLRHVVAKPIIQICQHGTSLPFDIKDNRTIFYKDDMLGVEELKENIAKFMNEIEYDEDYMDNPIYNARRYAKLLKDTQGTETNEILKLLIDMSSKMSDIKVSNESTNLNYPFINTINEMPYTFEEFLKERNGIDKSNVKAILENVNNSKIRVHELARMLETTSNFLVRVANMLDINIKNVMSSITPVEQKRILEFLLFK